MKRHKKALFTLIVLYASLLFLPATSFAEPAEILRFEPGDTLEEIRAKIKHNGYNFTVDHNWVFDMSAEDKKKFFGRHAPLFPRKIGVSEDIGPLAKHLGKQLPSSFDWRNHNGHSYIGPIRDQGSCGSCYAFAACAAAEGTYNWVNGKYDGNCVDFSESYIIWCLGRLQEYNSHFFGCWGSDWDYYELEALTVQGVTNEADFPYTTSDPGSCTHWDDPTTTFQSWHRIDCNDIDAIKTAIMTYGVVDAAVYAGDAFQGYSGDIYEDSYTSCPDNPCYYTYTNHAIALVGWNDNGGDGYWILRNSWGTSWGEDGYMRIKYTSARVACEATYLYLENPTGLKVSPLGGLTSEGQSGGPFSPDSITYTLENLNDTGINYTVSKGESWVSISETGGYLDGHATTEVTVSINPNANALSNGIYTDTVSFINTTDHDGDTTRSVTLTVGVPALQYSWNMDTDPGWTTEGLWAWGQPTGNGGQYGGPDPTSGYIGNNVCGYNLSGDYENNLSEKHLTSTAIDCTALSKVTLKFRRWLGVEQPAYDHAYVRISNDGSSWTTVWENSAEVADSAWSLQELDISSVADGQSTVYLRWTMGSTDSSWRYCGWNIDDIEIWAISTTAILYVDPGGTCGDNTPCHKSLQSAIDSVSAGATATIKAVQGNYDEDITLSTSKTWLTIQGGYDSSFTSQSGTTIAKSMMITNWVITPFNFALGGTTAAASTEGGEQVVKPDTIRVISLQGPRSGFYNLFPKHNSLQGTIEHSLLEFLKKTQIWTVHEGDYVFTLDAEHAGSVRNLIIHFYNTILDREAEPWAVDAWEQGYFNYALSFNIGVRYVASEMGRMFFNTEEYRNRKRSYTQFITDCHQAFFYRDPSDADLTQWLNGEVSRAEALMTYAYSDEFNKYIEGLFPGFDGLPTRNLVTAMYIDLLDRLVVGEDLLCWSEQFDKSADKREISKLLAQYVINSEEFESVEPTNRLVTMRLYRTFEGKVLDERELFYWIKDLDSGNRP